MEGFKGRARRQGGSQEARVVPGSARQDLEAELLSESSGVGVMCSVSVVTEKVPSLCPSGLLLGHGFNYLEPACCAHMTLCLLCCGCFSVCPIWGERVIDAERLSWAVGGST